MSEKQVTLDELMPLIKEQLTRGQSVVYFPRGISMLPMLREGKDSVVLSAPPKKLKKYDVSLYQRSNGQYVLHRVVKVEETYTCIGDNQFVFESGIAHSQVIAVCTAFLRDGRRISAGNPILRLYAVFWHYSRFPRRIWASICRRVLRVRNK